MNRYSHAWLGSLLIGIGLLWTVAAPGAEADTVAVRVNCNRGETIANALERDARQPLRLTIKGVCHEKVVIARSDVTLVADAAGGSIEGPDVNAPAVTVTGDNVALEGLSISGGRNGISAAGARRFRVTRCQVRNSARTGVVIYQGASSLVDGATVELNTRDGISVESASATIINSAVSQNTRSGIVVTNGGSARIGLDDTNGPAGTTIAANGSAGLLVSNGGSVSVGASTIAGNGTDPAGLFGRVGVAVVGASAQFPGGNTISDNAATGIFVRSGVLLMGNINPDLGTTVNTISGNGGFGSPQHGIEIFLNSSADLRNVVVTGNVGAGILVTTNSSATLTNDTVTGNTADGIQLTLGGVLFLGPPLSASSFNAGFGINCTDGESSLFGTIVADGNAAGSIAPTCSGF